jgi:hypothetical protein
LELILELFYLVWNQCGANFFILNLITSKMRNHISFVFHIEK